MAKIILIGRKYKIETSTSKIIPALNKNLKLFLSATIFSDQSETKQHDLKKQTWATRALYKEISDLIQETEGTRNERELTHQVAQPVIMVSAISHQQGHLTSGFPVWSFSASPLIMQFMTEWTNEPHPEQA